MSALRPYRIIAQRRLAGSATLRADAEKIAARYGAGAVIVNERSGERFARQGGRWLQAGHDLGIRMKRETSPPARSWWRDAD